MGHNYGRSYRLSEQAAHHMFSRKPNCEFSRIVVANVNKAYMNIGDGQMYRL